VRTWTDEQVQELLDKQAINDVLVRYCRGVDRLDGDLILSCYHPDAVDDHGRYRGTPQGLVDWLKSSAPNIQFMEHKLSNVFIDLQGDVAFVECYSAMHLQKGELFAEGLGRFIDRFERRDGEWKIAHRRVTLEYATPELGYDADDFAPSRRDRTDPSYDR
jgi:ketosteroid isomerase-like protein